MGLHDIFVRPAHGSHENDSQRNRTESASRIMWALIGKAFTSIQGLVIKTRWRAKVNTMLISLNGRPGADVAVTSRWSGPGT